MARNLGFSQMYQSFKNYLYVTDSLSSLKPRLVNGFPLLATPVPLSQQSRSGICSSSRQLCKFHHQCCQLPAVKMRSHCKLDGIHSSSSSGLMQRFATTHLRSYDNSNLLWKVNDVFAGSSTRCFHTTRSQLNSLTADEVKKAVESLTDQFMEARELLADARESMGTVYFSEDMEEAQEAVTETLNQYNELLEKLTTEQKENVLRTIGLKMEELKAQEIAIKEELHDDH